MLTKRTDDAALLITKTAIGLESLKLLSYNFKGKYGRLNIWENKFCRVFQFSVLKKEKIYNFVNFY